MSDPTEASSARLGTPFLLVWFGQTLSAIGSTLSGVGIGVWVFLETGSAAWLGVLVAVANLPTVVLIPMMRHIDRLSRRWVMVAGDSLAAVAASGLLALALSDHLEIWQLAVAAFVSGTGSAFQFPAFQASIPALVAPGALGRANGLTQFGPAVGITIGPLLAAPVVGWWGLEGVVIIDLVTFVVAIATVLAVRFGDVRQDTADDDGSWAVALGWLRREGRALLGLLLAMAAVNLVLSSVNVTLVALAVEVGGTDLAGVPLAAGGVAMIIGSLAIGARGLPRRRIRTFALALVVFGAGCWIAALRPSIALITAGTVVALLAVPAVNASMSTIFHEHVPHGMQGRVFALRGAIGQSLGPVGSVLAGVLIASVAAPAMAADGWAGRSIGRIIGVGTERGPALMFVVTGVALALLALRLATSWIVDELDLARPAATDPATDEPELSGSR